MTMETKLQQYLESYDDTGNYVKKAVTYDDQHLPSNIIIGNLNETFDDHNYITEQPYHDSTQLPYADVAIKTFVVDYRDSNLATMMQKINDQIINYIANVNHSLAKFENNGVGRISDHYQVKIETINDPDYDQLVKTVYFKRK